MLALLIIRLDEKAVIISNGGAYRVTCSHWAGYQRASSRHAGFSWIFRKKQSVGGLMRPVVQWTCVGAWLLPALPAEASLDTFFRVCLLLRIAQAWPQEGSVPLLTQIYDTGTRTKGNQWGGGRGGGRGGGVLFLYDDLPSLHGDKESDEFLKDLKIQEFGGLSSYNLWVIRDCRFEWAHCSTLFLCHLCCEQIIDTNEQ